MTDIAPLVRRVRLGLWREATLRLLSPALWVSALMLALGVLARWRLGTPGAVTLLALAALPVLAALGLALTRRPSLAEAALVADRRLGAEALLVTAWHLGQAEAASPEERPGARSGTGTGPLVLARARQAVQNWALDPRLAPSTPLPWTPMLAILAAVPLLGLNPIWIGPGGVGTASGTVSGTGSGSGVTSVQAPLSARGPDLSALAQAIAALGPEPGPQPGAERNLAPGPEGRAPGSRQAEVQPGPPAHPSAPQGQPAGSVSPGLTQVQPGPANPPDATAGLRPQTSASLAGGPGTGGPEGAGTLAMQRQAGQSEASPASTPDPDQAEQRVAVLRRPDGGPTDPADLPGAPLADPGSDPLGLPQVQPRISAARPPTPAESGPSDPAAFTQGLTPAQRALAARYFVLTQEAP